MKNNNRQYGWATTLTNHMFQKKNERFGIALSIINLFLNQDIFSNLILNNISLFNDINFSFTKSGVDKKLVKFDATIAAISSAAGGRFAHGILKYDYNSIMIKDDRGEGLKGFESETNVDKLRYILKKNKLLPVFYENVKTFVDYGTSAIVIKYVKADKDNEEIQFLTYDFNKIYFYNNKTTKVLIIKEKIDSIKMINDYPEWAKKNNLDCQTIREYDLTKIYIDYKYPVPNEAPIKDMKTREIIMYGEECVSDTYFKYQTFFIATTSSTANAYGQGNLEEGMSAVLMANGCSMSSFEGLMQLLRPSKLRTESVTFNLNQDGHEELDYTAGTVNTAHIAHSLTGSEGSVADNVSDMIQAPINLEVYQALRNEAHKELEAVYGMDIFSDLTPNNENTTATLERIEGHIVKFRGKTDSYVTQLLIPLIKEIASIYGMGDIDIELDSYVASSRRQQGILWLREETDIRLRIGQAKANNSLDEETEAKLTDRANKIFDNEVF